MSKWVRNCVIIGLILLLLGIIATAVSYGIGITNGGLSRSRITVDETYGLVNIQEIKVDIGTGDVTIREGDQFEIHATNVYEEFETKVSGDEWTIQSHKSGSGFWGFLRNASFLGWNYEPTVEIVIPKGYTLSKLKLDLGAGNLYIISGDFEEAKIDVGAGKFTGTNMITGSLDCNAGAGSLVYNGEIHGMAKLDCAAGDITLNLNQAEQDFNYNIDCAVGEITIGNSNYSGLGNHKKIENKADYNMDIDCGAGEVTIQFTQK